MPDEWASGEPGPSARSRYLTRFSAGIFALVMADRIHQEGAYLLYDSVVSQPVMRDRRCEGGIVESKSGREYYEAGVVVDATGDADVLHRAGVPTAQSVTDYVLTNQRLLLERIKDDERSSRHITSLPGLAQFRTTRCIDGDYTLRESAAYRHFDDSVAISSTRCRTAVWCEAATTI